MNIHLLFRSSFIFSLLLTAGLKAMDDINYSSIPLLPPPEVREADQIIQKTRTYLTISDEHAREIDHVYDGMPLTQAWHGEQVEQAATAFLKKFNIPDDDLVSSNQQQLRTRINKAIDTHRLTYLIDLFPLSSGINQDVSSIIHSYIPIRENQLARIYHHIYSTVEGLQKKIYKQIEEQKERRRACISCGGNVAGFICLAGVLVGSVMGGLAARYRCGISMSANLRKTCWQQPALQCCGEQIMYGDPIPGSYYLDALNSRISEIASKAGCTGDLSTFNGGGICAQEMDCAAVNTTSPSYYTNFNPCGKKKPTNIKPSTLARRIAMARDKQKRSKGPK